MVWVWVPEELKKIWAVPRQIERLKKKSEKKRADR